MIGLKERSDQFEIMDDMTMSGPELRRTLDLLASVNLWLGGNTLTLDGVEKMLKPSSREKVIRIVDLGCGNGDMLRKLHDFGKKKGYNVMYFRALYFLKLEAKCRFRIIQNYSCEQP